MKVKVEYLGHIKNIIGSSREEEVETSSEARVVDLMVKLSDRYGLPFKKAIYEPRSVDIKPNYIVTVNGYLLNQLKGLETRLKNGDCVAILPIVSGG